MDKYQVTADTFNRLAQRYQDKYMDLDLYNDTYDLFCRCIDKERADVLDVACGPGNITRYLLTQRPQFKLQGIDLAQNMIELARRNNPTATFRVLDGRQIAALGERFDGIICGFYLPYLSKEDAAQFIRAASGCLQPQGVLYLRGCRAIHSRCVGMLATARRSLPERHGRRRPKFRLSGIERRALSKT